MQLHQWYDSAVMKKLDLSPAADGEWEHILDRDRKLAEIAEPILDAIEAEELVGERFQNAARFTTFRVPGRDQLYAVVWEDRGDHFYLLRIGAVRLPQA